MALIEEGTRTKLVRVFFAFAKARRIFRNDHGRDEKVSR